ncbi:MAG: hypothetical protein A3D92_06330 [Bacteroidetes bacterium RIFCSPHIGHO2_02_FULL_44_7]|nr:MAG: hypothetical protein A3D92_06330 [Bacteroidetes bacterium RIFCSPHIGHO2_02_FULL_44_7]
MRQCTDFYTYRRSETVDAESKNVPLKQTDWDNDLTTAEHDVLANELARLQQAIYEHCHITNRPRTLDDDRKLYLILPEKLPADFRLELSRALL